MQKRDYCGNRPTKLRLLFIDFCVDFFVSIFGDKRTKESIFPKKILLFNFGHLGDMLMMGYMINALKQNFPKIEIHLVSGRWCKDLIDKNELFDKVFYVNHYKTNRSSASDFAKFRLYLTDIIAFISTQKNQFYTHSFDFRYSGHNGNILLPFLNINQKIGFGTVGYGGFLDKEYFIPQQNSHTIDIQVQGLNSLGLSINSKLILPKILLPNDVSNLLQLDTPFFMIFPEAGAANKMVNHEFWMRIINILVEKKDDSKIVICGLTEYSRELIIKLSRENCHKKIVDAIGKLSILQINSLLEKSEGAITLDSFPAHLASAQTRTFCLFKDGFGLEYLPINKFPVAVIHNHTPSKNVKDFRPNMNIRYIPSFEDSDSFKDIIQGVENIFNLN